MPAAQTGPFILEVDMRDLTNKMHKLASLLSTKNAEGMIHDTISDVGKKIRTPIDKAIREEYEVSQAFVLGAIGNVVQKGKKESYIKIASTRTTFTGSKSSGGMALADGKKAAANWKKTNAIQVKILKKQGSTLPPAMKHQGNNPPMVITFKTGHTGVYTRADGSGGYKGLVRVPGVSVPQMPFHQARSKVEQQILDKYAERIEHNFDRYWKKEVGSGK